MATFTEAFEGKLRERAASGVVTGTGGSALDAATDEEFLRRAYLDILGRLPEPEAQAHFLKVLEVGDATRTGLIWRLWTSDEAASTSDDRPLRGTVAEEVALWSRLCRLSALEAVESHILFVMALYRTVLERAPEPDGFLTHYRELLGGAPGRHLCTTMASSSESREVARRRGTAGAKSDVLYGRVLGEMRDLESTVHLQRAMATLITETIDDSHRLLVAEIGHARAEMRARFEELRAWAVRLEARLEAADRGAGPEDAA